MEEEPLGRHLTWMSDETLQKIYRERSREKSLKRRGSEEDIPGRENSTAKVRKLERVCLLRGTKSIQVKEIWLEYGISEVGKEQMWQMMIPEREAGAKS